MKFVVDWLSLVFAWLKLGLLDNMPAVGPNLLLWMSWKNLHWLGIVIVVFTAIANWVLPRHIVIRLWNMSVRLLSGNTWGLVVGWMDLLLWMDFVLKEVEVWCMVVNIFWVVLAGLAHFVMLGDWLFVLVALGGIFWVLEWVIITNILNSMNSLDRSVVLWGFIALPWLWRNILSNTGVGWVVSVHILS